MKNVTAAILMKDGLVLIARRNGAGRQAGRWEFPGGKVEPGETPEECLAREMKEELGIGIEILGPFGTSEYRYEHGAIRLLAFRVAWKSGDLRPTVHDALRWVAPGELARYEFSPADLPFVKKLASPGVNAPKHPVCTRSGRLA